MKFALFTGMTGTTWDDVLALWRHGDQTGWDAACRVLKALWTESKASYEGRYYRLDDAPLMPKPVQTPHPELMIGGGGQKVTLRIAAQHADHWNVWGGPGTLTHKGRILDEHCARVGRDPKRILRSSVMVLAFADDRAGVERMEQAYMKRMGADPEKARDTVLGGRASEIKDKLARLEASGVGMLFIPTFFLPADRRPPSIGSCPRSRPPSAPSPAHAGRPRRWSGSAR